MVALDKLRKQLVALKSSVTKRTKSINAALSSLQSSTICSSHLEELKNLLDCIILLELSIEKELHVVFTDEVRYWCAN